MDFEKECVERFVITKPYLYFYYTKDIGTKYVVQLCATENQNKCYVKTNTQVSFNNFADYALSIRHYHKFKTYNCDKYLSLDEVKQIYNLDQYVEKNIFSNVNSFNYVPRNIVEDLINKLISIAGNSAENIVATNSGGNCSVCGAFDEYAAPHKTTKKLVCYRHCQ